MCIPSFPFDVDMVDGRVLYLIVSGPDFYDPHPPFPSKMPGAYSVWVVHICTFVHYYVCLYVYVHDPVRLRLRLL